MILLSHISLLSVLGNDFRRLPFPFVRIKVEEKDMFGEVGEQYFYVG
jgi:hypothetical protein